MKIWRVSILLALITWIENLATVVVAFNLHHPHPSSTTAPGNVKKLNENHSFQCKNVNNSIRKRMYNQTVRKSSRLYSSGDEEYQYAVLTPFRAKYDPISLPHDNANKKESPSSSLSCYNTIPLTQALHSIKQTLKLILSSDDPTMKARIQKYVHKLADNSQVLRLEEYVTECESIDPLRWLRVQYDYIDTKEAIVSFADVEGVTDSVGIGSMHTLYSDGDLSSEMWDVMKSLPPSLPIRYYGGMRFDPEYPIEQRDGAWENFGGSYFVLPTVELRKDSITNKQVDTVMMRKDHTSSNGPIAMTASRQKRNKTTIAINLRYGHQYSKHRTMSDAIYDALNLLDSFLLDVSAPLVAPILPCIINQEENKNSSQENWENGVNEALSKMENSVNGTRSEDETLFGPNDCSKNKDQYQKEHFSSNVLKKVVLARSADTFFGDSFHPLDPLLRYKISGFYGNFLLLRPESLHNHQSPVFFGLSPERLFRIDDQTLETEALAGTRPRGSDAKADADLLADLISNPKDLSENIITANFIEDVFKNLHMKGLIYFDETNTWKGDRFVRRFRHLQHICQHFSARVSDGVETIALARDMMNQLHPTPAVCGFPRQESRSFIRKCEPFDRGFYAGPFGYISHERCEIVVSLRSGLITNDVVQESSQMKLTTYAGAGIVPGSTAQDEWTETQHKLGVIRSLFPPGPISLRGLPNANYAWATAIVEELIRSGVTDFMICPGSRSTPLTAVLARAARKHVGSIRVMSVHDERGAVFRCVGSARATGRPAVVVTSSGTAVANLYPGVMEASNDGVPLLLLTADRPYEARSTGANQAVDQVKVFGDRVRWFRDIPPPNDAIPISVGLSDINHAVNVALSMMGPVHLNIQFRENLSPDAGLIRGDNRVDSIESFNLQRFTDVPGFQKWAYGGSTFQEAFVNSSLSPSVDIRAVRTVMKLLKSSRRAIIVVGNMRGTDNNTLQSIISHAAISWSIPIFADVQSGFLRESPAVVLFADHILKNAEVFKRLKPDLILQIGHPLISVEVQKLIEYTMKSHQSSQLAPKHIFIHPHHSNERADPAFTVTHRISSNIGMLLNSVVDELNRAEVTISSDLFPILKLGRKLREAMPQLIHTASKSVCARRGLQGNNGALPLTEPQVILAINEVLSQQRRSSLFLSNSMPVRDADVFLYPLDGNASIPSRIAVNRGASGIDGIISSASAFSSSLQSPTTLLIGDVAALHDLNALHTLGSDSFLTVTPLTTVVVNNNGGGIFSFLPISKHGDDVGFDEFFGTPTETFSFAQAAQASGISYRSSSSFELFKASYAAALEEKGHNMVEARVVDRKANVEVHSEISKQSSEFINNILLKPPKERNQFIRMIEFNKSTQSSHQKTLLLLHGWLGSKSDWDVIAPEMSDFLSGWKILLIDLPGHGESPIASHLDDVRDALGILQSSQFDYSIDGLAISILSYLHDNAIELDAICGYSLGGRIGLAMRRLSLISQSDTFITNVIKENTKTVLISAYPGEFDFDDKSKLMTDETNQRMQNDSELSRKIKGIFNKISMTSTNTIDVWAPFLQKWYSSPLWGNLLNSPHYEAMKNRRAVELSRHGFDLSRILLNCSAPRNSLVDWKYVSPGLTLFIAGSSDEKYSTIGKKWRDAFDIHYEEIENAGHALLTESPQSIVGLVSNFIESDAYDNSIMKGNKALIDNIQQTVQTNKSISDRNTRVKITVSNLELNEFNIKLGKTEKKTGVYGIGWADKSRPTSEMKARKGIILSFLCDGLEGIGEVSPLPGLHSETLSDARKQLESIQKVINNHLILNKVIDITDILALNGSLTLSVAELVEVCGISSTALYPSVRAGIEMALISIAAQKYDKEVAEGLKVMSAELQQLDGFDTLYKLPINGIETRTPDEIIRVIDSENVSISYSSMKIKVGHRSIEEDVKFLISLMQENGKQKIRADANRSWLEKDALQFTMTLKKLGVDIDNIEYIEEPLNRLSGLDAHIQMLESFSAISGIKYGLDETLADLVFDENFVIDKISERLRQSLRNARGCAAFILKPTLLGTEVSLALSNLAHTLDIAAVYTSSFESGVGLSHIACIASLSDTLAYQRKVPTFPHGLGTFALMQEDVINPPFSSFVSSSGEIDMAKLAKNYHGSSLEETNIISTQQAKAETTVQASISLPFSSELASGRFADWPQQPRWSPWLASVTYVDRAFSSSFPNTPLASGNQSETEWTLNLRGVRLKWTAVSTVQPLPNKGTRVIWESTTGLPNRGNVDFFPLSPTSCQMTATVTFRTPRMVTVLFQNNDFLTDFLKNKLLRWSLEMFRDVVRSDLALERGDAELGDALFDAVEGKASAIEVTLMLGGEEWQ